MAAIDAKTPLRSELARVFKDQRMIKAFEQLFELVPKALDSNQTLIEEALNSSANAESNAALLFALLIVVQQMAEESALKNECVFVAHECDIHNSNLLLTSNEDIQNTDFQSRKLTLDSIGFDTSNSHAIGVGSLAWNSGDDTLNLGHSGGVIQQIGEEIFARITNSTGSTITNGQFIGLTGSGTAVTPFLANASVPPLYSIGVATQDIPSGERGRLTVWGRVRGLNTSSWAVGSILYSSSTISGGLTNIKPTAPNLVIPVGVVTASHATDGEIFVRPLIEQQLYYGAFVKTITASPAVIDTAYPITFDTTQVSNGVALGSPTSRIVAINSGLYSFNASFQLASGNSSIKNVWMWFRKNGVDVPNSSIIRSLESGTAVATQSRSQFFSLNAGDYIELIWAANNTNVTLDARAATGFAPAAPSCVLTVEQIQQ